MVGLKKSKPLKIKVESKLHEEKGLIKAKESLPKVKQQVNELQNKLKLRKEDKLTSIFIASLKWAIEDAELAIEAKMGINASNTLSDIQSMVKNYDSLILKGKTIPLPEAKYGDAKSNPYIARVEKGIPTGGKGARVAYASAWALTHTETRFFHNSELFERLLHLLQGIFQSHTGGNWTAGDTAYDSNINRFQLEPALGAYLMVKQQLGWALPPSKIKEWEQSIRVAVEFQYDTYGESISSPTVGLTNHISYANIDIVYVLIMELAYNLFGDTAYKKHANMFLKFLEDELYPMGAFADCADQNEQLNYHGVVISKLARYYELTGNKLARSILERTVDYYPYAIEPSGIGENYTDLSWKHLWGGHWGPPGPEIIAGLTGDGRNKTVANLLRAQWSRDWLYDIHAIPFYREIEAIPLPDNYIIYDENIMGPRGRYGSFSFAGTGRPFRIPTIPGKDTFVGCMISGACTLDSALQIATIEVRLTRRREGNHFTSGQYFAADEKNSVIMGEDFASLATEYQVSKPRWLEVAFDLIDWKGAQEWFLSKHRLIGLLSIESLKDQKAAGVHGRLRFGMEKVIESSDPTSWKYGMLLTKIREHNFGKITAKPSESVPFEKPENYKSTEITLEDEPSVKAVFQERPTYAKGTRLYFLAEVLPSWSSPATDVKTFTGENNILGFRFTDNKNIFFVLHNVSGQEATFTSSVKTAVSFATVYQGKDGKGKPWRLGGYPGKRELKVKLSPHEHVLIVVHE